MNRDNGRLRVKTSEIGARILSLQKGKNYYILPQQTVKRKGKNVIRGGMHLCSPIFGEKDGEFNTIPKHGGLRSAVWQLDNSSRDHSIKYEYELKIDGYWLIYNICYRLLHNCLQVITMIENKLDTPVPFEFGWHPYFFAPNGADISFVNSNIHIRQAYGPKIFNDDKIIVIELRGIGTVNLLLDKGFNNKHVCIWTDSKRYVCVEPLLSHPDDFNTERGFFLEKDKPFTTDLMMCFK